MRSPALLLSLTLLTTACAEDRLHHVRPGHQMTNWHMVASDADRERIAHWRDSFVAALKAARAQHGAEIDAEGPLLLPDSAQDRVAFGPGHYSCRIIKLGAQDPAMPTLKILPTVPCDVGTTGALLSLRLRAGPQRPDALLYPDLVRRMILLGSLTLGDEVMAHDYGQDATRDMAGIVERTDDGRWRILLPAPHFESLYDVIEVRVVP